MNLFSYLLPLFFCFFFLTTSLFAQKEEQVEKIPDYQKWSIKASYFGEQIVHPGFKIGLEYPFLATRTTRQGRKKVKKEGGMWLAAGHLGYYHHKENHRAMFLNAEVMRRRVWTKGYKLELFVGMGYLYSLLDGPTFEVTDNGNIVEHGISGQGGWMPSFGFGTGRDLYWKKGSPISWHFKGNYFFQIPFNAAFVLRSAWEIGVSYRLNTN